MTEVLARGGTAGWMGVHRIRPVTSLGHQVGRRIFIGAQIFLTMGNTFFQGGEKNLGKLSPLFPPGYGPAQNQQQ